MMSPVRAGIAILFVSSLLSAYVWFSQSSLFAQEATVAEIPYEELPICPPFTPDPLVPTPTADFSDDAPRCRVDAINTSEPAPSAVPTATPTYDPFWNVTPTPIATSILQDPFATPTYVPYDELPVCPPIILNSLTPTPIADPNGPVCRGPFVEWTATPVPTATNPPPAEPTQVPELANVPNQAYLLYLPMMQGEVPTSSKSTNSANGVQQKGTTLFLPSLHTAESVLSVVQAE